MAAGLMVGIGQHGTDTVFRRSFSALILAVCVSRDNEQHLLPPETILGWGDRIAGWFIRERDLRGYVEGKGWAHAVAHGADAIGALARSPRFGPLELTVLLDVLADRLLLPTDELFVSGEPDRMAAATLAVLHRNVVPLAVLEPWVGRLANTGGASADSDSVLSGVRLDLLLSLGHGARLHSHRRDRVSVPQAG
jgi:hypothetical protein